MITPRLSEQAAQLVGQQSAGAAGLFGNIPMAISFNPQLAALQNMQSARIPQKEGKRKGPAPPVRASLLHVTAVSCRVFVTDYKCQPGPSSPWGSRAAVVPQPQLPKEEVLEYRKTARCASI